MAVIRGGILIRSEEATGVIDGSNLDFNTQFNFVPGTLRVFLNGLEQLAPDDYSETGIDSFQFIQAPIGGIDPDRVTVQYQRA